MRRCCKSLRYSRFHNSQYDILTTARAIVEVSGLPKEVGIEVEAVVIKRGKSVEEISA